MEEELPEVGETVSERKKPKRAVDGHYYNFVEELKSGLHVFRRNKKNSMKCPARLYFNPETGDVQVTNVHTHDPDPAKVEADKIVERMRKRGLETVELPSQVVARCLPEVPSSVKQALPKEISIRKTISRDRSSHDAPPPNPADRESIEFPEEYTVFNDGEGDQRFLLIDTGANVPDPNRILVFGKQSVMDEVHLCSHLYMDGTFKSCPSLFSQVFVILGRRADFVYPLCYALLPNKSYDTYCRLFEELKGTWPGLNPEAVFCDFELALQMAIRDQFAGASIYGCYFHFAQNLWKCVQRNGLVSRYNNEPEFNLWVRMIAAMAYVPPKMLKPAMKTLRKKSPVQLEPLLDWLEGNYIGRADDDGHTPQFSPTIWSCFRRIRHFEDKTNNYTEAFHKKAMWHLQADHPCLWRFIKHLKGLQNLLDVQYEEFVRGEEPHKKRAKFVTADDRIREIIRGGERRTVTEYLRGIAANLSLK